MLRHASELPISRVPAYTTLDARLGWRLTRRLELAIVGQNLVDAGHAEWGQPAARAAQERAYFLKATWMEW
jgi:iron complex outermembrane receptor protein